MRAGLHGWHEGAEETRLRRRRAGLVSYVPPRAHRPRFDSPVPSFGIPAYYSCNANKGAALDMPDPMRPGQAHAQTAIGFHTVNYIPRGLGNRPLGTMTRSVMENLEVEGSCEVESWPSIWRRTMTGPQRDAPPEKEMPVPLVQNAMLRSMSRPEKQFPIPHVCRNEFFTTGTIVSDNGIQNAERFYAEVKPYEGLMRMRTCARGAKQNGARFTREQSELIVTNPHRQLK